MSPSMPAAATATCEKWCEAHDDDTRECSADLACYAEMGTELIESHPWPTDDAGSGVIRYVSALFPDLDGTSFAERAVLPADPALLRRAARLLNDTADRLQEATR